jgi:hypothetical protein
MAVVMEAVLVMQEVAVVVVQVGIEDQGLLTVVIPVAVVVVPLVVQLMGLEKEQLEKKVWLEMIKLDLVFDPMEM